MQSSCKWIYFIIFAYFVAVLRQAFLCHIYHFSLKCIHRLLGVMESSCSYWWCLVRGCFTLGHFSGAVSFVQGTSSTWVLFYIKLNIHTLALYRQNCIRGHFHIFRCQMDMNPSLIFLDVVCRGDRFQSGYQDPHLLEFS